MTYMLFLAGLMNLPLLIISGEWEQVRHNSMLQGTNGKTPLHFPVPVPFEVVMGLRCV